MTRYFADTNFYLRFLLQDNKEQAKKTQNFLERASEGEIEIIFISPVILEMTYVLESVYEVPREKIAQSLLTLIKTDYLEVQDRDVWVGVFELYKKKNISLFDIYLSMKSQGEGADVLTYDQKLERFHLSAVERTKKESREV